MNLKHHFLIAMPSLDDELFTRSVVYLFEHNDKGAMGIIINKPLAELSVQTLLSKLEINIDAIWQSPLLTQAVFNGGPLAQEHGFILHTGQELYASSIQVTEDIILTTSQDI